MRFLFLEKTHINLIKGIRQMGIECDEKINASRRSISNQIHIYDGIVIRSKFYIDKPFLDKAKRLKFIIRIGSGVEHINIALCRRRAIKCITTSEGSADAVGEHCICLILCLVKNIFTYFSEVKRYRWKRKEDRHIELNRLTLSIIGYGNTGKSLAKKAKSLNLNILCNDIKKKYGNKYAKQSSLEEIFEKTDILSINLPLKKDTINYVNYDFISKFKKPFYIINTSRGNIVDNDSLTKGLKEKKILGAGLDVFSIEEGEFNKHKPELASMDNVIISPHIASYTKESEINMSRIAIDKLKKSIL